MLIFSKVGAEEGRTGDTPLKPAPQWSINYRDRPLAGQVDCKSGKLTFDHFKFKY